MAQGDGTTSEHQLTPTGKGLDLSFLQKPHEHDPRRVFSTTATDWQSRVDFDRLRKDRLARARMMMEKHDLGALVCFVGENVRYITSVFQGNWKNNIFIRYCVLPRGGDPVLFETAGSDLECAKIDAPWLAGRIRPAITWKWSETAEQMMADRMVESIVEVLREEGVLERADRNRHLRSECGGGVRARRREDGQCMAGDVRRARRSRLPTSSSA